MFAKAPANRLLRSCGGSTGDEVAESGRELDWVGMAGGRPPRFKPGPLGRRDAGPITDVQEICNGSCPLLDSVKRGIVYLKELGEARRAASKGRSVWIEGDVKGGWTEQQYR